MPELPAVTGERCGAPGPWDVICDGAAGHPGLHGVNFPNVVRWTDAEAEAAAREANGEPEPADDRPTGTVYQLLDGGLGLWTGRITMTEHGVHCQLAVHDGTVTAVLVPWAQVRHVTYHA